MGYPNSIDWSNSLQQFTPPGDRCMRMVAYALPKRLLNRVSPLSYTLLNHERYERHELRWHAVFIRTFSVVRGIQNNILKR